MTPLTGELYAEALHMTRVAREAYVLIGGKYPHPQTVVPGGISATIDMSDMNEIHLRIVKFFDYGRKVVAIWNDLVDFFYEVNPQYREIGRRPANMIEPGQWDDPYAYDGTFANVDDWGRKRWAPPAVIVDGELVTTKMTALNMGVEEFVEHSFYEDWTDAGNGNGAYRFQGGPEREPAVAEPPLEQGDDPEDRRATNWKDKYSWSTAPRWDRMAMESGALLADVGERPRRGLLPPAVHRAHRQEPASSTSRRRACRRRDRVDGPLGELGRVRAQPGRAHAILYTALIAYENLLIGLDMMRKGETAVSTPYKVPKDSRSAPGSGAPDAATSPITW